MKTKNINFKKKNNIKLINAIYKYNITNLIN